MFSRPALDLISGALQRVPQTTDIFFAHRGAYNPHSCSPGCLDRFPAMRSLKEPRIGQRSFAKSRPPGAIWEVKIDLLTREPDQAYCIPTQV